MHLRTYLMLLGAALLVAHLKAADAFTLDRLSSSDAQRESLESVENARNQTLLSEDSNEEEEDARDSSSEEEDNIVKRSAQFSRDSDEFDNVSFEVNDRRTFQQNAPSQATNIGNFVFRNSNERDDISDEVRSIFAAPQITRITPTRTSTLPDRLPVPISLRNQPIRQFDNDDSIEIVRIVSTPTQQTVPVRTTGLPNRMPVPMGFRTPILRQSFDFDDDSIEIRDRVTAPIQQIGSTQTAAGNRVVGTRRPNIFRQSDERDDISVEVFSFNQNGQVQTAIRPVQQNRAQLIQNVRQANVIARPQVQSPVAVANQTPTTVNGFNLVFTDSAEQDDFSDEVIRSSVAAFAAPVTATPPRQTATPSSRLLPAPVGLSNQNIRPSNLNVNRVTITSAPVSRVVTTQTVNQAVPIQTVNRIVPTQTVNQVAPVQTVNRIVPGQTVNQAVPVQTVGRIVPAQAVNQVAPIQRVNQVTPTQAVNQAAPIQRVNQVAPVQTANRIVPTQTVNQVAPVQTANRIVQSQVFNQVAPIQRVNQVTPTQQTVNRIVPGQTANQAVPVQTFNRNIPTQTVNQVAPIQRVNQVTPTQIVNQVAPVQRVNQVVPTQTNNRVAPIQTANRIAPVQTVSRIVATPTVSRVFQTINLPDRLPVPMSFRNLVLRQTVDLDDDSIEINDRNVFSPVNTNNGQVQTFTPVSRPVFSQDDDDISVELELVSTIQNQQVAPAGPSVTQPAAAVQTTGNQGQQFVQRFDNDFSLEDDRDDDINESSFFLEGQMDRTDSFRLLATDFLLQPDTNGARSVRSANNRRQAKDNDDDHSLETKLSHSDEANFDESPIKESDDWFLVKQYMDHDYSSEELEGELAKQYFWQPVKDSSKKTA